MSVSYDTPLFRFDFMLVGSTNLTQGHKKGQESHCRHAQSLSCLFSSVPVLGLGLGLVLGVSRDATGS